MELRFRNDWTHHMDYRVRLHHRSDFAAFYHTFLLQSYAPLRIAPGEHILDAGAYIGIWTTLASMQAGPEGRVVAVEPDPGNFERLQYNLNLNGIANVRPIRKALWSTAGAVVKLDGRADDVKISDQGDQEAATVTIDMLSELCDGRIDRIKMTITGAEFEALKAARDVIPRCRQIVMEVYGASNLARVDAFLRAEGFEVQVAPFESLARAAREFVRHPLLAGLVESQNYFRTARRLVIHVAGSREPARKPPAEYWLLQAAR